VPRPRPTPSTQDQRSDGRGQMTDHPCRPPLRDPGPVREHRTAAAHGSGSHALPMLAHRQRIPMPRPDLTPTSEEAGNDGRTCFTVTTRFTIS
jgi:hypothetical protein